MKITPEDKFIKDFRRAKKLLREMESRGDMSEAVFALRKKVNAVEKTAEYYAKKYKRTYSGEPFDAIGAYESYFRYCELRSSRKRDIAPSKKSWMKYRCEFRRRVKTESES